MIIVDDDAASDTASTTRTLTPEEPEPQIQIPPYFGAIIAISLSLSFFAFIATLVAFARFDLVHAIPIILAFALSLGFHTTAALYAWLHAHGKASIMPATPFSVRGVATAAVTTILWAQATGFILQRAVRVLSWRRDYCVGSVYTGAEYVPCAVYYPRGKEQLPTILAAASTVVEMILFAGVGILCEIYRRQAEKLSSETGDSRSDTTGPESKEVQS